MVAILLWLGTAVMGVDAPSASSWWDSKVEASLRRAPARERDWVRMLESTKPEHRTGTAYLVADLPLQDLEALPPEALAANVALAYQARGEVPWGAGLPETVFLDAVLPHASVTEPRESMRAEFHTRYLPLVKDAKGPGEAAHRINKALFKDYKVSYNTRRLRTDQSSKESIAQGMATCTGLSIMLVEACRSVGIPARLAGIHSWPGRGGNHTWVEIWDEGWHFAGAAEPDENGLDRGWFVGDAARAIKGMPENAIFAVTYRASGELFPIAWADEAKGRKVNGENVTDRYTRGKTPAPVDPRLMVEVCRGGRRVEADVTALEELTGATRLSGKSLGPQTDVNLHLSSPAKAGESFLVVARHDGHATTRSVTVAKEDTVVRLDIDGPAPADTQAKLSSLLADRFGTDPAKQAVARKLLAGVPVDAKARDLAWQAYKASPALEPLRKEFEAKTVKTADRSSPYRWRHVGTKPKGGWPLVIAMHGGGGVPKELNDSQWTKMYQAYYEDHPEVGGYIYLALRAPNDAWNGFYDDAIAPLIERLIRQFVVFGEVDPDRVYTLGASHGGYGAFVIGPKIPDRFAWVHSAAAAPTPGETLGENLRNTRFTFLVGEKDTDHGRADRCLEYARQVESWRARHGGYPGGLVWLPGVGHLVPDRDRVARMIEADPRNPWPSHLVWAQSDNVLTHFYWIEAPKPADHARVEASARNNTITLDATGQTELALWLDAPLVDLAKPVTIDVLGGSSLKITPNPNLETYCIGLDERGDPRLAAPVRVVVPLPG